MKHVDDIVCDAIGSKQFGGIAGTSTTDALGEITHRWYEATDKLNTYVRVVMLDFSEAFDPLTTSGLPVHIARWIGAFLPDRSQKGIIVLALVALMEGYHMVPCLTRNVFIVH